MKNYFIHGIQIKWISDSNPSHRKDSDGQRISPYACYIAIFHPKVCFHKAGQGVKVSRQALDRMERWPESKGIGSESQGSTL